MHRIETLTVNGSPMEVFLLNPKARGPFPASCWLRTYQAAIPESR